MISDRLTTFGTAQPITTTGPSTDVVEFDARAFQSGTPFDVAIQVTTAVAAAGAATVRFQLQGTDDSAFTTNVATLAESGDFPKAVLTAGAVASLRAAASKLGPRKFARVNYVVSNGPLTAGAFSAFVALDVQSAPVHFPSGLRF